ncbi:unnamed protein product [Symbiodinium microadriaticum]|nr:unnamed protein product [Symbiodinium microadriaticum]
MGYIYHERQLGGLCGVHCLNNLLQGPAFGPGDLAEIGVHLDQQERALVRSQSSQSQGGAGLEGQPYNVDSSADGGNFSIQVLTVALERYHLELVPSRHPDVKEKMQDPASATQAFLCQYHDHWFAIRKVLDGWWNLNSTRKRPAQVGPFYLAAWLAQLQAEGYTIFLVLGSFPEPTQPSTDDQHGMENFHSVTDLLEKAKSSGGNPVMNEPDSDEEGLADFVELSEPILETRNRVSLADARASMREMGFETPQIDIALQLGANDGEVASQFLAIMYPVENPEVGTNPEVWAREMQACILGLDMVNASMDIVVQGLLRIGTLLSYPQAICIFVISTEAVCSNGTIEHAENAAAKSGILVREGQALSSKACDDRLATGASLKELQLVGDRLRYELLTGTGPKSGWVSTKISGKELVVRRAAAPAEAVKMPEFEVLDESYLSMKKGASPTGKTPWLKMLGKTNPDAKGRLVIFSWTGNRGGQGSAHNFMKPASPAWTEHLKSFQQYEVNYPGRGTRVKDPLYEDPAKYVTDIVVALQDALKDGLPFVLLGFSFGSILAVEVARSLQAKDMGPLAVVVVSAEAPQWPGRASLGLAGLGEARFEQMLKDKGGTEFILQDPGMKKMFVPVITADCKLEENYRFDVSAGPLKCPLLVFYGKKEGHDKMKTIIGADAAEPWMDLTACPKLSKLQVLESDWYVFQDAGATEAVAAGIQDLCKVVLMVIAVVAVVIATLLAWHPLCGFVFAGDRPTSDIQHLRVLGLAAVSYGAGSVDKAALLAAVREGVAERGGEEIWQAGASALAQNLDASQEDAELILAKAFGWTGWYELNRPSYLKPKLPPAPQQIFEALSWLRQGPLQLTAEQLRNALAIKPLVYLKEPRSSYESALQVAPEQWRSPDAFKELLLREPQVLDLTHNCLLTDPAERIKDEWGEAVHCDGKCTHCWRTATPKLMGKVLDGVEV